MSPTAAIPRELHDPEISISTVQTFFCADLENILKKVSFHLRISKRTNDWNQDYSPVIPQELQ